MKRVVHYLLTVSWVGPYCDISDLILLVTGSAALDETLYRKGYLLKVSAMRI